MNLTTQQEIEIKKLEFVIAETDAKFVENDKERKQDALMEMKFIKNDIDSLYRRLNHEREAGL